MNVTITIDKELKPCLTVHAENDVEALALATWSNSYEISKNDEPKAYLCISMNLLGNHFHAKNVNRGLAVKISEE